MKLAALVAAVVLALGCSSKKQDAPPAPPATHHVDPRVLELRVVDENSQFMQRVFSHIGANRDGSPTDPDAIAAHVRADEDVWTDESGNHFTDYYAIGPDRATLEKYLAQFTLPADRVLGYQQVKPGEWRTYYLQRMPELDATDVAHAETSFDRNINRPVVFVDFTDKAKQHFGELTTRIVGHKLAAVVNGTVESAPIIISPIRGGRASVVFGGNDRPQLEHDAHALADALNGAEPQ
jgi:SecD-like export protein